MFSTNQSILIIDDNHSHLQKVLNFLFEGGFYNVQCSTSIEEASVQIKKVLPELIFVDIQNPTQTYFESIVLLREAGLAKIIPILIASQSDKYDNFFNNEFDLGAIAMVCKPYDKNELLTRIKSIFSVTELIEHSEIQNVETSLQNDFFSSHEKISSSIMNASQENLVLSNFNCYHKKNQWSITKKIDEEAEFYKRELELFVLKHFQYNELLIQLLKQLGKVVNLPISSCQYKIILKEMMQKINMVIKDKIWDELEMRISQVHPNYFKSLLLSYPNLTETDLRLLAFLKLNLSSKEVADITGQQLNTVKAARKRLRRRLNLKESNTSIMTFLARF